MYGKRLFFEDLEVRDVIPHTSGLYTHKGPRILQFEEDHYKVLLGVVFWN
jgi:hypothetical protein